MLKQKVLIEFHTRDLNHNKHFPLTEACPNSLIFVGTFLAALVVTYLRTLPVMVLKPKSRVSQLKSESQVGRHIFLLLHKSCHDSDPQVAEE